MTRGTLSLCCEHFKSSVGRQLITSRPPGCCSETERPSVFRRGTLKGDAPLELQAKVVVNATGVFSEDILAMDGAARGSLLAMSQGTHFVLPHSFLSGGAALMVPKTADGRVLFAIPWHGATLVGTTDEAVDHASAEPRSMQSERNFLFEHIDRYFGRRPKTEEILSVWSGLRPLVRKGNGKTSKLSRDHTILVSKSGVVTVTGGKWTTYRRMGQDAIDHAAEVAGLPKVASRTLDLKLHGWTDQVAGIAESERVYGTDLPSIQHLSAEDPALEKLLHPRLPYRCREVVWAARYEMARTVEDVLARRTRALFLDATSSNRSCACRGRCAGKRTWQKCGLARRRICKVS